jgi:hypothetical protein
MATLRIRAERIRQFHEKAQALWDGLKTDEQASLRGSLLTHPNPVDAMPTLLPMLRAGRRAEAEELVGKAYAVDARKGGIITSLIADANEIDLPPPASPPPAQGTRSGAKAADSNSGDPARKRNTGQGSR